MITLTKLSHSNIFNRYVITQNFFSFTAKSEIPCFLYFAGNWTPQQSCKMYFSRIIFYDLFFCECFILLLDLRLRWPLRGMLFSRNMGAVSAAFFYDCSVRHRDRICAFWRVLPLGWIFSLALGKLSVWVKSNRGSTLEWLCMIWGSPSQTSLSGMQKQSRRQPKKKKKANTPQMCSVKASLSLSLLAVSRYALPWILSACDASLDRIHSSRPSDWLTADELTGSLDVQALI